jgi:hypothetical protein
MSSSSDDLKMFVEDLVLPIAEVQDPKNPEQQQPDAELLPLVLTIRDLPNLCLIQFLDSLRKSLRLEPEQVFNWYAYANKGPDQKWDTNQDFPLLIQLPRFALEYSLCLISEVSNKVRFGDILLCSAARQHLLNLIEIIYSELGPNRGYTYIPEATVNLNRSKKQAIYVWFAKQKRFQPDKDTGGGVQEVELPIAFPEQKFSKIAKLPTINEDFLVLVAQACCLQYSVAFDLTNKDDPILCLQDKLQSAAEQAMAAIGMNKVTLYNKVFPNTAMRVFFIRLLSHYFAEKQVLTASAAVNKAIAKVRSEETLFLLKKLYKFTSNR